MNQKKRNCSFINLFLSLVLFFSLTIPALADSQTSEDFSVEAKAALALDFETGKIFYEKNSETELEIASLTKLISFYVIQTKIKNGELAWEDPVVISKNAATLSTLPELSNIPLVEGKSYSVKELFDAAVIVSANAATVALAEKIAGTEFAFVDLMKAQLIDWGIEDPFIVNASGLNNEDLPGEVYPGSTKTSENKLTAKEIALVARNLIRDFPETLAVSSQASLIYENSEQEESIMYTTNLLLPGMPLAKPGVDGLKTGTTDLAGRSLVATMKQEDRRVITVLLNAGDENNPDARYTETSRLLDYSFEYWEKKEVTKEGESVPTINPVPVQKSLTTEVPLIAQDSIELFLPRDETVESAVTYTVDFLNKEKSLTAPIAANHEVATLAITYKDDPLGYLEPVADPTTLLLTSKMIEQASFLQLTWQKIQQFFTNIF